MRFPQKDSVVSLQKTFITKIAALGKMSGTQIVKRIIVYISLPRSL